MPLSQAQKNQYFPQLSKDTITGHVQFNIFNHIDFPELEAWAKEAGLTIMDSYYMDEVGERLLDGDIKNFHDRTSVSSVVKVRKSN